jgi:hypothetical protein
VSRENSSPTNVRVINREEWDGWGMKRGWGGNRRVQGFGGET